MLSLAISLIACTSALAQNPILNMDGDTLTKASIHFSSEKFEMFEAEFRSGVYIDGFPNTGHATASNSENLVYFDVKDQETNECWSIDGLLGLDSFNVRVPKPTLKLEIPALGVNLETARIFLIYKEGSWKFFYVVKGDDSAPLITFPLGKEVFDITVTIGDVEHLVPISSKEGVVEHQELGKVTYSF